MVAIPPETSFILYFVLLLFAGLTDSFFPRELDNSYIRSQSLMALHNIQLSMLATRPLCCLLKYFFLIDYTDTDSVDVQCYI